MRTVLPGSLRSVPEIWEGSEGAADMVRLQVASSNLPVELRQDWPTGLCVCPLQPAAAGTGFAGCQPQLSFALHLQGLL